MPGAATATVKGGFWPENGVTSLVSANGDSPAKRQVAQLMGQRGMMALRQLARALDGVVAGSNATKTLGRIEANVELGGKRVIETNTLVNRNTAAGDVTEINNDLYTMSANTTFGATPPANKDGNPLGTR